MKAILINAKARSIRDIDFEGSYKDIQELVGCSLFTVIDLGDGETLFIDDEGLLHDPEYFFGLVGPDYRYPQPLAGNGLILGSNAAGDSIATKLNAASFSKNVRFARLKVAGWTQGSSEEGAEMPWGGRGFVIHGPQPIFERRADNDNGGDAA